MMRVILFEFILLILTQTPMLLATDMSNQDKESNPFYTPARRFSIEAPNEENAVAALQALKALQRHQPSHIPYLISNITCFSSKYFETLPPAPLTSRIREDLKLLYQLATYNIETIAHHLSQLDVLLCRICPVTLSASCLHESCGNCRTIHTETHQSLINQGRYYTAVRVGIRDLLDADDRAIPPLSEHPRMLAINQKFRKKFFVTVNYNPKIDRYLTPAYYSYLLTEINNHIEYMYTEKRQLEECKHRNLVVPSPREVINENMKITKGLEEQIEKSRKRRLYILSLLGSVKEI